MARIFSTNFINKTILFLLFFLCAINLAVSLYFPIMAVFVTKNIAHGTLATVGIAIAIACIVKSVIQIFLAKRLDSIAGETDDYYTILFGSIIAIIYSFGFLFIREIWQLNLLQVLVGIGDACAMAAFYAIFSHHIDKESEGFEWSLFSVGITISGALGAMIGGFVAERYGFNAIFIGAGFLNILAMIFIICLYPHMKILRKPHHYKTIVHEK